MAEFKIGARCTATINSIIEPPEKGHGRRKAYLLQMSVGDAFFISPKLEATYRRTLNYLKGLGYTQRFGVGKIIENGENGRTVVWRKS